MKLGGLIKKIVTRANVEAANLLIKTQLCVPEKFCGVTFSFDDFPETAINAANILERAKSFGTFYTSFGLLNKDTPSGKAANLEQIKELAVRGHEIAGHTYDHYNFAHYPFDKIRQTCDKNREFAQSNGFDLENFSYPQGGVTVRSKQYIQKNYNSARSIIHGINRGKCDRYNLKAVCLYERHSGALVNDYIEDLKENGGWLILYTHDVQPNPSRYGVSVERFQNTVNLCEQLYIPIMTVKEALSVIDRENGDE